MDTWMWIIVLIVAVVLAAVGAYVLAARQRSARLKKRFGPEYDRAVTSAGDRREAEAELRDVAARRERVEIVPLSTSTRRRYAADWEAVQQQFVDEPERAVSAADDLIVAVMADRGYPVHDFDERADMVSADHPEVVNHYRTANAVRRLGAQATTEDLREAFVHYRALFDKMLADETVDADIATEAHKNESREHPGRHHDDAGGAPRRTP